MSEPDKLAPAAYRAVLETLTALVVHLKVVKDIQVNYPNGISERLTKKQYAEVKKLLEQIDSLIDGVRG
jgi:hypothetical protein